MTSKADRLLERLREQTSIPEGAVIHRTYAGSLQRSSGAWSWFVMDRNGREVCLGSCYSVTHLLRCGQIRVSRLWGDRHVDPV